MEIADRQKAKAIIGLSLLFSSSLVITVLPARQRLENVVYYVASNFLILMVG